MAVAILAFFNSLWPWTSAPFELYPARTAALPGLRSTTYSSMNLSFLGFSALVPMPVAVCRSVVSSVMPQSLRQLLRRAKFLSAAFKGKALPFPAPRLWGERRSCANSGEKHDSPKFGTRFPLNASRLYRHPALSNFLGLLKRMAT